MSYRCEGCGNTTCLDTCPTRAADVIAELRRALAWVIDVCDRYVPAARLDAAEDRDVVDYARKVLG